MRGDVPTIEILGVPVACLDIQPALDTVEKLHTTESGSARVCYVNAHTLNLAWRDPDLRAALTGAELVLGDGSGVGLAARMRGRRFPANLNGTDLNPLILALAARRGWPVFFLGGTPGVAERAAARWLAELPALRVAGAHHGYTTPEEQPELLAMIRASRAELLLVGMGNPVQERWLAEHLEASGARIGVGVGAFLDFSAGVVPRCPPWMSRYGIEWVYRLCLEPGRMWRRYLVGNPMFVLRAMRTRR